MVFEERQVKNISSLCKIKKELMQNDVQCSEIHYALTEYVPQLKEPQ
jgi:hypothetical protein